MERGGNWNYFSREPRWSKLLFLPLLDKKKEPLKKRKKANKKAKDDKKSRKHVRREDSDEGNSSEEIGNDGDDNEDNDDNSDLFPEFDSAPSQTTRGQKQVYPGISFWIVIDVPYSCMSDIDTNIRQFSCSLSLEWKSINASKSTPVARVEI